MPAISLNNQRETRLRQISTPGQTAAGSLTFLHPRPSLPISPNFLLHQQHHSQSPDQIGEWASANGCPVSPTLTLFAESCSGSVSSAERVTGGDSSPNPSVANVSSPFDGRFSVDLETLMRVYSPTGQISQQQPLFHDDSRRCPSTQSLASVEHSIPTSAQQQNTVCLPDAFTRLSQGMQQPHWSAGDSSAFTAFRPAYLAGAFPPQPQNSLQNSVFRCPLQLPPYAQPWRTWPWPALPRQVFCAGVSQQGLTAGSSGFVGAAMLTAPHHEREPSAHAATVSVPSTSSGVRKRRHRNDTDGSSDAADSAPRSDEPDVRMRRRDCPNTGEARRVSDVIAAAVVPTGSSPLSQHAEQEENLGPEEEDEEEISAYSRTVMIGGRLCHSSQLRRDLEAPALTAALSHAQQIEASALIDVNCHEFWSMFHCRNSGPQRYKRGTKKYQNVVHARNRHIAEKKKEALAEYVNGLIALLTPQSKAAAEVAAANPLVQAVVRLAIRRRLVEPMLEDGTNSSSFERMLEAEQLGHFWEGIREQSSSMADARYCCLLAQTGVYLKEQAEQRDGVLVRNYAFADDADADMIIAAQVANSRCSNYSDVVRLLKIHYIFAPTNILGILEKIRHAETLGHLRGCRCGISRTHFTRGCVCLGLWNRYAGLAKQGDSAPPQLTRIMYEHLPTSDTNNVNVAVAASVYFRLIVQAGWRDGLPSWVPQANATTLFVGERLFSFVYIGSRSTSEQEQRQLGLASKTRVLCISEQERMEYRSPFEPTCAIDKVKEFLTKLIGSFDPCTIEIFCMATLESFVELRAALHRAGVISRSSHWSSLEITINSRRRQTINALASDPAIACPTGFEVDEMKIRSLGLCLDTAAIQAHGQGTTAHFNAGSSILRDAFAAIGVSSESARNNLDELCVSGVPLDQKHDLVDLFGDQDSWPATAKLRVLNCNLKTVNTPMLRHALQSGRLSVLNAGYHDFSDTTAAAMSSTLQELRHGLSGGGLSLCYCNFQPDTLIVLIRATIGGFVSLKQLALDGNTNLSSALVFAVLLERLKNLMLSPDGLQKLCVMNVNFSVEQTCLIQDWAEAINKAARIRFGARSNDVQFVPPVLISRIDQATSKATAVRLTVGLETDQVDWFNNCHETQFEICL